MEETTAEPALVVLAVKLVVELWPPLAIPPLVAPPVADPVPVVDVVPVEVFALPTGVPVRV